ncbi:DNL-type zinc finger protein [Aspergillus homomorphus CBS 101889]|uniref:Mitochondrial import protein Zim17 n=1 Tax=Aspergillus homomorphus (strain CBS 101889) TaxID=1450537 RepID=A0A395IBA6_ASPHC|nr:mitochondrial import protein Zim17 [Aspergillus homomorphus CBS 101889]RAL17255.1 mitochondrial import protein Zim17 [Aspergillus homomorphus CBS 101889]
MRSIQSLSHGLRAIRSLPRTATLTTRNATVSSLASSSTPSRTLSHLTQRTPTSRPTTLRKIPFLTTRHKSDTTETSSANNLTDRQSNAATDAEHAEQNRLRREQEPAYQITFTCKPCGERSSHRMSKHGYHRGTVLIQCPSCSNRHVIADHLNIFFDRNSTLEDILARQGDTLLRGYVEGDMEVWENGEICLGGLLR